MREADRSWGFDLSCFEGFDNVNGWINTSYLGETARRR